jgi:hypothetical protein
MVGGGGAASTPTLGIQLPTPTRRLGEGSIIDGDLAVVVVAIVIVVVVAVVAVCRRSAPRETARW